MIYIYIYRERERERERSTRAYTIFSSRAPPDRQVRRGSQGMGVVSNNWFDCGSLNSFNVQTLMLTDVQTPLPWDPLSCP